MRCLIYRSKRPNGRTLARAWLSTDHSASHYGGQVLLVDLGKGEEVVGWSDLLPSGLSGADFLERVAAGDRSNHAKLTAAAAEALDSILRDVRAWRGQGGSQG